MAIKKLNLTEDHVKLIAAMNPNLVDIKGKEDEFYGVGLNSNSLWGGGYLYEDIALVLGFYDEHIPGTENDFEGKRYSKEKEDYMLSLYDYIKENLYYILSLVLQFSTKGGIKAGTYKCIDYQLNWERVEE